MKKVFQLFSLLLLTATVADQASARRRVPDCGRISTQDCSQVVLQGTGDKCENYFKASMRGFTQCASNLVAAGCSNTTTECRPARGQRR